MSEFEFPYSRTYHLTCDAPANMCPTDGTGGTMIAHFLSEDRTRCCVAVALRKRIVRDAAVAEVGADDSDTSEEEQPLP